MSPLSPCLWAFKNKSSLILCISEGIFSSLHSNIFLDLRNHFQFYTKKEAESTIRIPKCYSQPVVDFPVLTDLPLGSNEASSSAATSTTGLFGLFEAVDETEGDLGAAASGFNSCLDGVVASDLTLRMKVVQF